jgi:hypothetical protein
METRFSNEVLTRILDQAMIYQCACPAQVCRSINELRGLFAYQADCLDLTDTDKAVHRRIVEAVKVSHAEMEKCLEDILRLEGWDMNTYQMPDALMNRILRQF